jgi:hypothetical protein
MERTTEILKNTTNIIQNALTVNRPYTTNLLMYAILLVVIGVVVYYNVYYNNYIKSKCKLIQRVYKDFAKVTSINPDDPKYKNYKLRDYYIKTAYNCCALGDFKNTYVDLCALDNVLKQGVRCLDFEIYSLKGKPVVAVSSKDEYYIKESFNSILLGDVLDHINNYAFSGSKCPNSKDPLILHFRIKSKNKPMYDVMAELIYTKLSTRLLEPSYGNEYNGNNLSSDNIKDFMGKIIVSVDKANPLFEDTKMKEITNIASNSIFMRALRDDGVKFTPDFEELIEFNKKNITISMPNLSSTDENVEAAVHMRYGCQCIAMNYQNYDEHLEFIDTFFENEGHAFVLKPEELRYTPTVINNPPQQNPQLSFGPRVVSKPYVDIKI